MGEFLTRGTIWMAIVGYAVGSVIFALSRTREYSTTEPQSTRRTHGEKWEASARVIWTLACASLIAHFVSAFHFYHGWSHAAAFEDTARQTQDVIGFNWGGGVYINYALLVLWIADIGWWWRSGIDSYRKRPWPLVAAWHGLFIFIIFNATVVFGDGVVRWVGLVVCVVLTIAWWRIVRE